MFPLKKHAALALLASLLLLGCIQDKAASARASIENTQEYRSFAANNPSATFFCVYWNDAVVVSKKAEFSAACGREVLPRPMYQCIGEGSGGKKFFGLASYDDGKLECANSSYVEPSASSPSTPAAKASINATASQASTAAPTSAPVASATPRPSATATPAPSTTATPTSTPSPTPTPVATCSDGTPLRQCSRTPGYENYYCAPDGSFTLHYGACP